MLSIKEYYNLEEIMVIDSIHMEFKTRAISLLKKTDWTQISSVSDPALSNPYLANKNEFDIYRNSVRQYALNPVAGDITWPIMPQEVWTTV
jgi:hypothetical protein